MADAPIALFDPDPAWAARFAEQRDRLMPLLQPFLAGAIEHIGSTAVPGLRAKPIIDLLAPVHALETATAVIPLLERDGWLFWPNDPNRHYRLWFLRPRPEARTHHLQVIAHDDPALRALIAFRDTLRADAALRQAYATLKEELAQRHTTDRNAYSNAKTEFVRTALRARGLPDPPRRAV